MDPFIATIMMFAGNFAPVGWALCNGQLLPISQNTALFSLIGTYYGGNGTTNFQLPNFQGRVPIHQGNGAGLSPYVVGQSGGVETVTLTQTQMPQHNHTVSAVGTTGTGTTPSGTLSAATALTAPEKLYSTDAGTVTMNPAMLSLAGGSQPVTVVQPYLAVTFCIALVGIFPSRN